VLLSRLFSSCRKLRKGDENFTRLLVVTEKLSQLRKSADEEAQESDCRPKRFLSFFLSFSFFFLAFGMDLYYCFSNYALF
jgi:hypothetical protein